MPSIVLGTWDLTVNKQICLPAHMELATLVVERDDKEENTKISKF